MLIVMEHRDIHARLELRLDLEAFRRLDVFQIDAAEGRLQRCNHADDVIDFGRVDLDVEAVDAGEFLEQDRLAFHHRLGGERPDIAEAEHGGAVGHHGDKVGAAGEFGGLRGIGGDGFAGRRHARRIGQRQIALVGERLCRLDFKFSGPWQAMINERARAQIVRKRGGHSSLPNAVLHASAFSSEAD